MSFRFRICSGGNDSTSFAGRYVNSAETGANLRKGCASSFTDWFCKSAIFQFLVGVKEKLSKETACILVICPLRSLIQNQIGEAISLGLTANYLPEASLDDAGDGKFQLLFLSAENVVCLRKRPARPALLK